MRLEVVCAMLAIDVVTIGTSAEDSGRPWRNYVDDDEDGRERSRWWQAVAKLCR